MRNFFFLFVAICSLPATAQTWQSHSFSEYNYNFEIQFPSQPTIEKSNTDSTVKMNATLNGVTYYLIATKTKDAAGAVTACNNAMNSTTSKAKSVELNTASAINSIKTTQVKYISQKDVYVNSHWFSSGNAVYQLMSLKMSSYGDAALSDQFFNSFKLKTGGSDKVSIIPGDKTGTAFKANDRVEVLYPTDGKYYKGTILKANTDGTYRVTYDGYASTYDEDAKADRIRLLTTGSTSTTTTTSTTTATGKYAVNDRVEVLDASQNKWFGAIILKVNADGTYLVAYDGYADTYDENVDASKIQAATTATTTDKVPYVKAIKGQTISFTGNLNTGFVLDDLEWAESSSMACWPGIRNVEFEGSHVGYWFDLPKKSIVKITVTPKSPSTRINIYGYSGFDFKKLPPEVSRCTTCEASHPTWIGEPDLSEPAQPQTIEFNATTRHNFVYFAVAGARGVTSGEYTVTIELI